MVETYVAIAGFAMVGMGFSVIVPELFRLGGKIETIDSAQAMSIVAGSGFLGFLIGPVFLGFLAKASTLKLSFMALLVFTCISLLTALSIRYKR